MMPSAGLGAEDTGHTPSLRRLSTLPLKPPRPCLEGELVTASPLRKSQSPARGALGVPPLQGDCPDPAGKQLGCPPPERNILSRTPVVCAS